MLARRLAQPQSPRNPFVCLFCSLQRAPTRPQNRRYASQSKGGATDASIEPKDHGNSTKNLSHSAQSQADQTGDKPARAALNPPKEKTPPKATKTRKIPNKQKAGVKLLHIKKVISKQTPKKIRMVPSTSHTGDENMSGGVSLKDAMLKPKKLTHRPASKSLKQAIQADVPVERLYPEKLDFKAIEVEVPPVPMLAHGLDRVLFNPGVYRLQDPRSRIYNFDPYLERIMPPREFDFNAISAYETSSKDTTLLDMARKQGTKFTGSTSSMSGSLVHFHYLLSQWRTLGTDHLSKGFPVPSNKFTKIQKAPSAIFLRYKDGVHAIDADKEYDTPNIMSWLGNSLELLLTNTVPEFERYRRSNEENGSPDSDEHGRCYHYSQLGNVLMRSQLDAHDPRLPGTGVFDLKTRAVVSIRMGAGEYETGLGYQLHYEHGEWESYEREYFDMMRATMLKYSLQVRMGRMDGIFVAYHNVERIFGFEYVPLTEMDQVLHGQPDTCLGDQEFKLSIQLLSELLEKATESFPKTSIRLHFETRPAEVPFMYIFAEPVTEEEADAIQSSGQDAIREFERTVIGIERDDDRSKAEWKEIQARVDEEMEEDEENDEEDVVDDTDDARDEDDDHDGAALVSAEEIREEIDLEIDSDDTEGANDEVPLATETDDDGAPEQSNEAASEMEDENGRAEVDSESSESPENTDPDTEEGENETPATSADEGGTEIESEAAQDTSTHPPHVKGWTLTIRNRVNGSFVARPENLRPEDDWSIEYTIAEITPLRVDTLYEAVIARRKKLLTFNKDQENNSWKGFRETIRKYTQKGRDWRETQDAIDARLGKRVFRPLGPGSGKEGKED